MTHDCTQTQSNEINVTASQTVLALNKSAIYSNYFVSPESGPLDMLIFLPFYEKYWFLMKEKLES